LDAVEFSQWLEGMGRLNGEQMALAIAKLGEFGSQAGRRRSGEVVGSWQSPDAGFDEASSTEEPRRRRALPIERDVLGTIGEHKVERLG